jgi:hypothetical protein
MPDNIAPCADAQADIGISLGHGASRLGRSIRGAIKCKASILPLLFAAPQLE